MKETGFTLAEILITLMIRVGSLTHYQKPSKLIVGGEMHSIQTKNNTESKFPPYFSKTIKQADLIKQKSFFL